MHMKEIKTHQIGHCWITWGVTIFVVMLTLQTVSGRDQDRFKLRKPAPNKFDDYASIEYEPPRRPPPPPPPRRIEVDERKNFDIRPRTSEVKYRPPPPPPAPLPPSRSNPFPPSRDIDPAGYHGDDGYRPRNKGRGRSNYSPSYGGSSGERYHERQKMDMAPLETDVSPVGGSDEA